MPFQRYGEVISDLKSMKLFTWSALNRKQRWLLIVAIALVYSILACWALQLAFNHTNASPVWPPSGIAFIVVLLFGYRTWPAIWLGAFSSNLIIFLANHFAGLKSSLILSSSIAVGNTLEALACVFLLRCFIGDEHPLLKVRNIFKFVGVILVACTISATIGVSSICIYRNINGPIFQMIWLTWWLGDVLGILVLGSLFLTFYKHRWQGYSFRYIIEAILAITVLTVINFSIFTGKFIDSLPVVYLILPTTIWSVYRFGYAGAMVSIIITLSMAIFGTIHNLGPFVADIVNKALVSMQSFIGIITVTALVLAAALYERHKAEESLRSSEERFRALVENSQDMVALMDQNAVIFYASPAITNVLGYPVEDYIGHQLLELIHQDDQAYNIERLNEVFVAPGSIVHGQCRCYHKDGKWRWVGGTAHNMLHEPGVKGIVLNYRDITDKKKYEEILERDKESLEILVDERSKELLRAQTQLKQVGRLADIGTLAATVAHELRNPLGVIQMAAHNLRQEKIDLLEDSHLINIDKKVWEGNQIINNLLSYSRIRIPCYERIKIFDILDECVMDVQERFKDKPIVVNKNYDSDHFSLIKADVNQLKEILVNILNNAYQSFSNQGGVVDVTARCELEWIKVEIKDTGAGIAEADLPMIFEPFFTRKSKGTGLGLSICNELINLHQGKIEITSQEGIGTTVSIALPIQRQNHEENIDH